MPNGEDRFKVILTGLPIMQQKGVIADPQKITPDQAREAFKVGMAFEFQEAVEQMKRNRTHERKNTIKSFTQSNGARQEPIADANRMPELQLCG